MPFLLVVLVIVAAVVIWIIARDKPASDTPASSKPSALLIQNVREGGVLTLKGIGPELEDLDLVVRKRNLYIEDGFQWHELEAECGNRTIWLDVEEDDELEVSVTLEKLKLSDVGLTPDKLAEIERSDSGTIAFRDRDFEFDDWGEATFFRGGDRSSGGERFKYWDFEDEDETRFIGIERWGASSYEVFYSESVSERQIEIFGLEGTGE